jgi:hypothetical protein
MIFQGFYTLGLAPGDTPDLRVLIVMSGFTGEAEEDAIHLADITTLDEFDGIGYSHLDCAGVVVAYDTAADELQVTFDNGAGDEFGDPMAPGSDLPYGFLLVAGDPATPATCVVVAFTADGAGIQSNNGPLGFTLPAGGWLYGTGI